MPRRRSGKDPCGAGCDYLNMTSRPKPAMMSGASLRLLSLLLRLLSPSHDEPLPYVCIPQRLIYVSGNVSGQTTRSHVGIFVSVISFSRSQPWMSPSSYVQVKVKWSSITLGHFKARIMVKPPNEPACPDSQCSNCFTTPFMIGPMFLRRCDFRDIVASRKLHKPHPSPSVTRRRQGGGSPQQTNPDCALHDQAA